MQRDPLSSLTLASLCQCILFGLAILCSGFEDDQQTTLSSTRRLGWSVATPMKVKKVSTKRRIPNVLIVGAQKAGTTALVAQLRRESHTVCGATPRDQMAYTKKESHFFDLYFDEGLEYYQSIYAHCADSERILLDATPSYLSLAPRIAELYEAYGSAQTLKVIVTLREPVSREISWYNHLIYESGREEPAEWAHDVLHEDGSQLTFEEHLAEHVLPSIERGQNYGLYDKHLSQWFELFRRDQIFVASYDDFKANATDFVERVYNFLDIPITAVDVPHANSHHSKKADSPSCEIQTQLAQVYEKSNERLYDLLKANPGVYPEKSNFSEFQFQCQETRRL